MQSCFSYKCLYSSRCCPNERDKRLKFENIAQPLRLSEWNKNDEITFSLRGRKYTYRDETLAKKAFLGRFYSSGGLPSSYVEKLCWREMEHGEKGTVKYGVNVEGGAFSCDSHDKLGKSKWNLKAFYSDFILISIIYVLLYVVKSLGVFVTQNV